jgi:hypothetical protein
MCLRSARAGCRSAHGTYGNARRPGEPSRRSASCQQRRAQFPGQARSADFGSTEPALAATLRPEPELASARNRAQARPLPIHEVRAVARRFHLAGLLGTSSAVGCDRLPGTMGSSGSA